MSKIPESIPPKTLEDALYTINRMKQKHKKDQKKLVWIAMLLVVLMLVAGDMIGYQTGYHAALVDFGIIAGIPV